MADDERSGGGRVWKAVKRTYDATEKARAVVKATGAAASMTFSTGPSTPAHDQAVPPSRTDATYSTPASAEAVRAQQAPIGQPTAVRAAPPDRVAPQQRAHPADGTKIAADVVGVKDSSKPESPLQPAKDLDGGRASDAAARDTGGPGGRQPQQAPTYDRRTGRDDRSGDDRRSGTSTPERGRRWTDTGRHYREQPDRGGERQGHEPRGTGTPDGPRQPRGPAGRGAGQRSVAESSRGPAPSSSGRRFAPAEQQAKQQERTRQPTGQAPQRAAGQPARRDFTPKKSGPDKGPSK